MYASFGMYCIQVIIAMLVHLLQLFILGLVNGVNSPNCLNENLYNYSCIAI